MATSTLKLSPAEVSSIVREYLTANGYKVETVDFDVTSQVPGWDKVANVNSRFSLEPQCI